MSGNPICNDSRGVPAVFASLNGALWAPTGWFISGFRFKSPQSQRETHPKTSLISALCRAMNPNPRSALMKIPTPRRERQKGKPKATFRRWIRLEWAPWRPSWPPCPRDPRRGLSSAKWRPVNRPGSSSLERIPFFFRVELKQVAQTNRCGSIHNKKSKEAWNLLGTHENFKADQTDCPSRSQTYEPTNVDPSFKWNPLDWTGRRVCFKE